MECAGHLKKGHKNKRQSPSRRDFTLTRFIGSGALLKMPID